MTQRLFRPTILAALVLAGLPSCSDVTGTEVSGDELIFIRQSPTAPALQTEVVSFWAKRGEDVDIRLPYQNGHDCLRFRLDDGSLLAYPDGRRFADGDSVQITIRLAQPGTFNFEFQPAGLRFDPSEPAELRVSYAYSDPDIDQDGDVDANDQLEFDDASFWRQETPESDWRKIGTVRFDSTDEMRAELSGFTRYALASN
jgi:hypothetical protein